MTSCMRSIGLLLVSIVALQAQVTLGGRYHLRGTFNLGTAFTPIVYDVRETFETQPGYDLAGWSETGSGTMDEDFSTAGLGMQAAQCVRINGTANESYIAKLMSVPRGQAWIVGYMRFAALPANDGVKLFRMNGNGGVTTMFFVYINAAGTLFCEDFNGTTSANTVDAIVVDTTYKFRFFYVKGAGSSQCSIEFSTSAFNASGNDYTATPATGNSNVDGDQLYMYGGKGAGSGVVIYYDDVVIDDVIVGFNP